MKKIVSVVMSLLMLSVIAFGAYSCGAGSDTIQIGGTGPLTGEYASYGTSVQNGAKLAAKEINDAGGLNGVKFSVEMKDDQGDPEKAQNGFNSLFSSGMQASIGSVTSGACTSFATAAKENSVFVLTPSSSDAGVIAVGDNVFRVCFGDPDQGKIAADTLVGTYAKVGVLYDTSIDYSAGIFAAFESQMKVLGKSADVDYKAIGYPQGTSDFSTYIDTLKSFGCDVIFLPIYYQAAGLVAKAAAAKNYNVPIFGADGLDGIASQIDKTVTATISYITPFDVKSTDAKVSAFVTAYRKEYNADPDQFAADGYDAVMIIYEALKVAVANGKTVDASTAAAAMNEILCGIITSSSFKYSGVTGTNMAWDASGACAKEAMIVNVR